MRKHRWVGIIIILVGLSILFSFPFLHIIIAVLLIWIGVKMTGKTWNFNDYEESLNVSENDLEKVFILSPVNKIVHSDSFKDGKVTCIFSGGIIDFSRVKTNAKEINLEIINIFAGLKIILPKDWKVHSLQNNVVGGIEDNTKGAGKTVVNLKGSSIFGGLEIVN